MCHTYFLQRCNIKTEEVKSFQQMVLECLEIQRQKKMDLDLNIILTKNFLKIDYELKCIIIRKTVRHLVTNIDENFCDAGLGKVFLASKFA